MKEENDLKEKAIKSCFDLENIKELEDDEVIYLTKGELYKLIDIAINLTLKEQAKKMFVDVEDFYNNNEHTGFDEELKEWFKLKDKWLK